MNKRILWPVSEDIKARYRCRVLECRLAAGIAKQKELARLTGISPTIISDLEAGKLFLSSPYALRISEVLECNVSDLFERRLTKGERENVGEA